MNLSFAKIDVNLDAWGNHQTIAIIKKFKIMLC